MKIYFGKNERFSKKNSRKLKDRRKLFEVLLTLNKKIQLMTNKFWVRNEVKWFRIRSEWPQNRFYKLSVRSGVDY